MINKNFHFANYKIKLFKIALPIVLGRLISQIQMVIDRIFLGNYDINYMSAIGNANAPMWLVIDFIFSLSMGTSILISQSIGAKDEKRARELSASLLVFHNILPVLLFLVWFIFSPSIYQVMGVAESVMPHCVTYTRFYSPILLLLGVDATIGVILQSSGNTKPLVIAGIIKSCINVFLDYCLIFGNFGFPKLGIAGAAIATTIAEFCGEIYLILAVVKNRKLMTRPTSVDVRTVKIADYFKCAKLGLPPAMEGFLWNFGNLMMVRILNTISSSAAGIYSILFTVEILALVVICAIGSGTLTLSSEATGAKDITMFRNVVKTSFIWCAIVSSITLVVVLIWPTQLLRLFTKESAVIQVASGFLFLLSINLYGKSANIIVGNGIRGFGNTQWMFGTQVFGTIFVILMACLCVFVLKLEILGVLIALMSDEFVRAIINTIKFIKIKFDV